MFERKLPVLKDLGLQAKYNEQINSKNIGELSKRKISSILKKENRSWRDAFLHNIVSKWYYDNHSMSEKFLLELNSIIGKTQIRLDDLEKDELLVLEEQIFTIDRSVKNLDVTFDIAFSEVAMGKFTDAKLYRVKKKGFESIMTGDFVITSKRLIIIGEEQIDFNYSDIAKYWYMNFGFSFKTIQGQIFTIRIHDQRTLNNQMDNLFRKKIKVMLEKRGKDDYS